MTSVRIESIAAGGDGVGRLADGMTVFVPRTAPGDLVEIEVTQRKARFARGRLARLAEPGPGRVDPRCPHYERDACGGCQLQHLDQATQLTAKHGIVEAALRRIGGLEWSSPSVVPAPAAWTYRSKITLAAGPGGTLGYHRWDRPDLVFPLNECLLANEAVGGLWRELKPHARLLPAGLKQLVLRTDRFGGRHVVARGGGAPWDPAPLAGAIGPASIWWQPERGAARVVAGERTGFPATAFEQVHPALASRVRRDALTALGDPRGRTIWDLYGGIGDAARALAQDGGDVSSVDADAAAVAWAQEQATTGTGGGTVRYLHAPVEEAIYRLPPPDLVLVNPPRAGLGGRVVSPLRRQRESGRASRLVYVSCDPATLARDLKGLVPPYRGRVVAAYDLFPQTAHVETVVALEAA